MKNYWTICGHATSKLRGLKPGVAAMLLTLSILLVSLGSPSTTCSQGYESAEAATSLVDTLANEVRLLEIDLDEARKLHEIDKYYWELREQMYKKALAEAREPWYERLATHPVVWVTIGMLVGVQAASH